MEAGYPSTWNPALAAGMLLIIALRLDLVLTSLKWLVTAAVAGAAWAGGPENVAVVVNANSAASGEIAAYYIQKRGVPERQVCLIRTTAEETIERARFDREIAAPLARCLKARGLTERVLYLVTTLGVPLRIAGSEGPDGTRAAVDSELCLLYAGRHRLEGGIPNPYFGRRGEAFSHPRFPVYLVTRLAGYDVAGVKRMIDRGLVARNRGRVVLDAQGDSERAGDAWLRDAAIRLPDWRALLDERAEPVYDVKDVIGYAGWGSNDPQRTRRRTGFGWLAGALATEYVSTDGRTFRRPPESWTPGRDWNTPAAWFERSPQSLAADYLEEGATGASGHVYEPYLQYTPRPELLFPAYLGGANLAESFYVAIPALSWQNIVIGDPLCRLAGR
jgi:uncharacterized protein (TIGR03790 family)